MFIVIVIASVISYFLFKKFKSRIKGIIGEKEVEFNFFVGLSNEYSIFNNVTIRDRNDYTTQIDHVVVSKFGIFVIETKNYKGWIYGSEYQKQWTQKFYKSSYQFQNPLHQNYRHIKVLNELLKTIVSYSDMHSIIVFSNRCVFKTEMPMNVFQGENWLNYIKSFDQKILSNLQIQQIKNIIENRRMQPSIKTHRKHIQSLKSRLEDKKSA